MSLITHPFFAFGIFVISLKMGALLSLLLDDCQWFSRFGAIASIGAFFASIRSPTKGFEPGMYLTHTYNEFDDPVFIENNVEEEWRNVKRERQNIVIRNIGIVCIVISTLIWGFGDLACDYV